MDPAAPDAIDRLLGHYHMRLLASPAVRTRLDALGIATPAMILEHGLGLVDRTAQRALLPPGARDAAALRAVWRAAGFLLPNGRERLRGCLVLPLPGSATAIGVPLRELGRRGGRPVDAPTGVVQLFAPARAAHASELVCTLDPLDALMLCRCGARWVVAGAGAPDAAGIARLCAEVLAAAPSVVRLIAPGTRDGQALLDRLTAAVAAQDRTIRVVPLPAGCHVRDLRRLHGDEAVVSLLHEGMPRVRTGAGPRAPDTPRPAPPVAPWAGQPGSLAAALDAHLVHLEATGLPPEAIRRRMRALERFRRASQARGLVAVETLSIEALDAFQRTLLAGASEPDAPRTRNAVIRVLATVRQFLAWARRTGRLAGDLSDGITALRRTAAPPPPVLSAAEVERILDATRVRTATGLRDRAMLEVLYSCGIRRVELVGLDVQDLDPARGVLAVRRGKGGTTRLVPLGRRAGQWVARYVETARVRHLASAGEAALFLTRRGRRISGKMVTSRMRRCLQAAGITKAGSCHIFRHSVATLMHDGGADIRDLQALLGHALLTSTQLYTRVSMQRLLEVHARTHPAERLADSSDGR